MRTIDADAFTRRLDAVQSASLTPAQVMKLLGEEPTVGETPSTPVAPDNGFREMTIELDMYDLFNRIVEVYQTEDVIRNKIILKIRKREKHERSGGVHTRTLSKRRSPPANGRSGSRMPTRRGAQLAGSGCGNAWVTTT